MEVEFTPRGFGKVSFSDYNGVECSLQESSLATDNAIWLGVDKIGNRMHLTQEQVKELLPFLISFAETGDISDD